MSSRQDSNHTARSSSKRPNGTSRRKTRQASQPAPKAPIDPVPARAPFLIVGVGASAGGLDAFTRLLQALPIDAGMAFVMIQHLAATRESVLAELLGKATQMPVYRVHDGMLIEPNHVYVAPPDFDLAIFHGKLNLLPRGDVYGPRTSIDHFFQSLADDQQSLAIGVVLSGSASDGTLGLAAIKAAGGVTFAQDNASARFSDMPRHARSTGQVDYILPPEQIAAELAWIGRRPFLRKAASTPAESLPPDGENDLDPIFSLLRAATGIEFTDYKRTMIQRRIDHRMLLHQIDQLADYVRYLQDSRDEVDQLRRDLLTDMTSFFRNASVFEMLKQTVFPGLIQAHSPEMPMRVWVPGCSTGEEVYSMAISLLECSQDVTPKPPVQLFGTDIDEASIAKARAGRYPEDVAQEVSPARLRRFFVRTDQGYQIGRSVRNMCAFALHDVTRDPPLSKMNLISCRNLLTYLVPELQKKVLSTFHYALQPDGFLLLDDSEPIGRFADRFRLLDKQHRLYMKMRVPRSGRSRSSGG